MPLTSRQRSIVAGMRPGVGSLVLLALTASIVIVLAPGPAEAAPAPVARFPAAGELLRVIVARVAPSPSAAVVARMQRYRRDAQFEIVLALAARRDARGGWWYRVSLPGAPNGRRGWIPAEAADVRPVTNRIVVHRGARRLEVRRVRDGRLLLRTMAAVGRPGAQTPLGRDFYVTSAFVPTDPFFGSFALETSAYARVSDWPTHVVGIHGTSLPELLGHAVSHGCVRIANDVASRLRLLAPLGTPIDVVP
jgi:lipoprotein-anchoring transpeptidase ErfK/SrfK